MTNDKTLTLHLEARIAEFENTIAAFVVRMAQHGALLEIATGITDGRIPCADEELTIAASELVDYLNSPEKWPVVEKAA